MKAARGGRRDDGHTLAPSDNSRSRSKSSQRAVNFRPWRGVRSSTNAKNCTKRLAPETEAKVAEVRAAAGAIAVPATLDAPHELVAMSAKLLRKVKPSRGVLNCRDERCLDISVSPTSIERALRIVDTLIRALEALHRRVEVTEVRRPDRQRMPRYHDPRCDADQAAEGRGIRKRSRRLRYAKT